MPVYMLCPFLEGQQNEQCEVEYLYNKKFPGVDIGYIGKLTLHYKKTNSLKLKEFLIELIGEEMFNLFIQEYIEDINPNTGRINQYSVLPNSKIAVELKKALEKIIENKERITEVLTS